LRCTSPRDHVHHKSAGALEVISSIVSIACASSQMESLQVRQGDKLQSLRPQVHLIIRSDPGYFKSTILQGVGRQFGITPYSNVTFPAMIGTIDQSTGKIVPGLVWQTRNKPLLLDEFKTGERGDSASVDVLLGTMEDGHYKRKIGLRSDSCYEEDGPLFYRVEKGEIEVQTRFSSIIATMKNWDMARSGKYAALTQRCIPVRYSLDDETVDDVLDGKQIPYKHREYRSPRNARIGRGDYQRIRKLASDLRDNNEPFRKVYTRAIGDLCRILAVTGRFSPELFRLVCHLKSGLSLEQTLQRLERS